MNYQIFELFLPICAIVFSTLLIIVYFLKKRVNLTENKMYSVMLVCALIDSLLVFIEKGIAVNKTIDSFTPFLKFIVFILNKIDASTLVVLTSCLFLYIFVITLKPDNNTYKKVLYFSAICDSIFICMTFFLKLSIITDGTILSISGTALYPVYVACSLYILLSIIITLKNLKKITKKHIPLFVIIIIFFLQILIFTFNPYLTVISIFLTFSNYVMYYTIENPDVRILEELHKSKEVSDTANEEKTMFLYNMTQEIREIVNEINSSANDILDSNLVDENKDSARNIIATTSKFTTLTNDLLDISSVDTDNIKVYNNKYNIKNILKQVVSISNDKCKNKGLQFITNIDNNVPNELYGDSIGLKEVLNVILDNAYKYTNKGYVEFDVNTIIKNDVCRLIITVEDSGIGIKSGDINNLKVSNTSLAKANGLITKMNGTMLISSDFGGGTKVKIVIDQKIVVSDDVVITKYESIFNNINILTIDDSEAGLKIIDKLLNGTNIRIDKANTGKECLDKIRINKYDVVLLDENLEEISGLELMKKIKEVRNFNTPVILLTKDNSYEYNEEYVKVGFSDYLLKPLKKDELLDKINKYTKK